MALIPKTFAHSKDFKGRVSRTSIDFKKHFPYGGLFIQALESGRLTPKQVMAARRILRKYIKSSGGRVRTLVRAYVQVTGKALATRMGRGKGKIATSVCPVRAGSMIFAVSCEDPAALQIACTQVKYRLPVQVKVLQASLKKRSPASRQLPLVCGLEQPSTKFV